MAADACDRMQRESCQDEDALLFRKFAGQRTSAKGNRGGNQGHYAVTPSGELLASSSNTDPKALAEIRGAQVTQAAGELKDYTYNAGLQQLYEDESLRLSNGFRVDVPEQADRDGFLVTGGEAVQESSQSDPLACDRSQPLQQLPVEVGERTACSPRRQGHRQLRLE